MDLNTSKISTHALFLLVETIKKGYCYINLNVKYEEHVHSKPPHKLAFKIMDPLGCRPINAYV